MPCAIGLMLSTAMDEERSSIVREPLFVVFTKVLLCNYQATMLLNREAVRSQSPCFPS